MVCRPRILGPSFLGLWLRTMIVHPCMIQQKTPFWGVYNGIGVTAVHESSLGICLSVGVWRLFCNRIIQPLPCFPSIWTKSGTCHGAREWWFLLYPNVLVLFPFADIATQNISFYEEYRLPNTHVKRKSLQKQGNLIKVSELVQILIQKIILHQVSLSIIICVAVSRDT